MTIKKLIEKEKDTLITNTIKMYDSLEWSKAKVKETPDDVRELDIEETNQLIKDSKDKDEIAELKAKIVLKRSYEEHLTNIAKTEEGLADNTKSYQRISNCESTIKSLLK